MGCADWFPRGPTFEKTYGFLKMVSGSSGCLVASPRKRPTSFRGSMAFYRLHQGSTGCIGVHRWGRWSLVGWVLGDWVCTWGLLGMMGGLLFISQTVSSIFGGCLWPDRSGSGHDDFLVTRQRRAAEDCYVHQLEFLSFLLSFCIRCRTSVSTTETMAASMAVAPQ